MYFIRSDLSQITGINATSVYLQLPDGVEVTTELAEISAGFGRRKTLIEGIETLIEQQTQIFQAIMYLGLLFTIAVMLNTMIMNVAERDFELATLRVIGASTKRLGGMLLFESDNWYSRWNCGGYCRIFRCNWTSKFILFLAILCTRLNSA